MAGPFPQLNESPITKEKSQRWQVVGDTFTQSTCPILVGFRPAVPGSSFCVIINFLMSWLKKSDYDLKRLIMTQKLEPGIAGLKPTRTGRVDRVLFDLTALAMEPHTCHSDSDVLKTSYMKNVVMQWVKPLFCVYSQSWAQRRYSAAPLLFSVPLLFR